MDSRTRVAGLTIVPMGPGEALDALWGDARLGRPRVYAFINAYSATLRRSHPRYAQLLEDEMVTGLADGAPVEWAARLFGEPGARRCAGPDFLVSAAVRAAGDSTPFFLLGGAEGVAQALGESLVAANPGLRIAGTMAPPFGEWSAEENERMRTAVKESGARIVWLGVSAPKQEIWAREHAEELGLPIVCVGAAFDFLSGAKPRAPRWMRAVGLEWLFRLATEPRRMWKRYLIGNARFVVDLIRFGSRPVERDRGARG